MGKVLPLKAGGAEFFVALGFGFLDSDTASRVSAAALHTYLHLRRFERRHKSANRGVNALIADGWVVAAVSVSKLAARVGVERHTITRLLKELEAAEWIIRPRDAKATYLIGRAEKSADRYFVDLRDGSLAPYRGPPVMSKLVENVPSDGNKMFPGDGRKCSLEVDKDEVEKFRNTARASPAVVLPETDQSPLETDLATNDQNELLETEEDPADMSDKDTRKSHAEYLANLAAGKTDEQIAKNRKRDAERQVQKERRAEIAAQNLRGEGFPDPSKRDLYLGLEAIWKDGFRKLQPDMKQAPWGGKERGQLGHLIEKYDPQIVATTFRYVLGNWDKIRKRVYKTAVVPTIGMVLGAHDTLVMEAQAWAQYAKLNAQIEAWYAAHPGEFLPDDLEAEREKHRLTLEALGLK